ncbi:MAG: dUTP diphosphatase [Campylobacteraceae bacterium]|jgi:dUTP pyrophosphatase|nr:dUTP diphosphatase [Campylobacteraceae bacterium]
MKKLDVKVKILSADAVIPKYQTSEAAGFDLHSVDEKTIKAGERDVVKTGLAVTLPNGYELQVRPRSGLALKNGITVLNTPGTVDSDYRGELMVILLNTSKEDFVIKKGDRIAQAVIKEILQADFAVVDELDSTERGSKGFGSTGK